MGSFHLLLFHRQHLLETVSKILQRPKEAFVHFTPESDMPINFFLNVVKCHCRCHHLLFYL